ncbi:MAG TPA: DPP IV N-terminal domain-containing protein, partial [Terriglobales bacterium]|nr:DPP IV N-terminal domain-containing protein [Terriglobales bacterium]
VYRTGFFRSGMAATAFQNPSISSLTSSGDIIISRISPDGKYLAYIANNKGKYSLWVRQLTVASAVQIIPPGNDPLNNVAFTPDGNFLDYTITRTQEVHGKVFQLPVLGGTPRLVAVDVDTEVSFSPDASQITYAKVDPPNSKLIVMIAKADGKDAHQLAELSSSNVYGNYVLRWSPDGKRIAALDKTIRDAEGLDVGLVEIDVASGKAKNILGRRWRDVMDFTWLPDGSGFLLSALNKTGQEPQIWLVSYSNGSVRRISNDLSRYLSISISADGKTIASTQQNVSSSLWVGSVHSPDDIHQVTSGRLDGQQSVAFLPDNRLVYIANHAENWDIFVSDLDGNTRQLTFDNRFHQVLDVCDHGKSIVYGTDSSSGGEIWKLDPQTGSASKLVDGLLPSCGGSDFVFYMRQDASGSYIFKVPFAGGTPQKVSERPSFSPPFVSMDGHHVTFATAGKDGVVDALTLSADTGATEAERLVPPTFDNVNHAGCITSTNQSMALSDVRSGAPNLWEIPYSGHNPEKQITHFNSGLIWTCGYSPDGKYFAVARGAVQSDVVLFTSGK